MKPTMQFSGSRRKDLRHTLLTAIAVVALLRPYLFSIAGTETTFTLYNKTKYFLHASINNESFVYIAPRGSVVMDVTAPTIVFARVRYSPGQAVKGSAEREVNVGETVTSSGGSNTCNDNQGNSCNSTEPTVTSSATAGYWNVESSDLVREE